MRQETLAALRLSAMTGGKGRLCVSDVGDDVSRQGVIGLQVSVIRQTTLKHAHELEVSGCTASTDGSLCLHLLGN